MEEPAIRPPRRRAPAAWPAFPGEHGGIGLGRRHQDGDLVDPPPAKSSSTCSSTGTRSKPSCCNSCRPHQRSKHSHQHASRNQKIEYDDVFGGPPKYLSSIRASCKKKTTTVPDYDDIFRVHSPTVKYPATAVKSKSKTTELPVFDPPEYKRESSSGGGPSSCRSPPLSPITDAAYDDVFGGGPLTGTSTKLVKELLKCSGKHGAKSKPASQSDSSPVSSMHSVSRGNPIYDYDDVFGGQSPATLRSFIHMASDHCQKPVMTSVSVTSSPFGDASTMPSSSPGTSRHVGETATHQYDRVYKNGQEDVEAASSSSSGSLELDFRERGSANGYGKVRRRQRLRNSAAGRNARPPVDASSNEESAEEEAVEAQKVRTTLRSRIMEEASLEDLINSLSGREKLKDAMPASFVTVENVKLTTEPRCQPPARPAPSQPGNPESELPESESFMEYSIKDLDGLVAEEYVVSHESVSESSSSSVKTSPSSQSYENTDQSDCYEVKDRKVTRDKCAGASSSEEPQPNRSKIDAVEDRFENTEQKPDACSDDTSGATKEEFSSSSSSFSELRSFKAAENTSGEWSTLCDFEEIKGESPERRKSRWERHQRAQERVAKALAERNDRDLEVERIAAEKQKMAEHLDDAVNGWAAGKQGNVRALLSTLQYILWPECGWFPVSLIDIIEPVAVRKAYRKATLCVHPDKMQQKGASLKHRYIAERVFGHLQEAWTIFNYEQIHCSQQGR